MRLKYALASPLATCAVGVTALTNINHCDRHDVTTDEHLNDVTEEGVPGACWDRQFAPHRGRRARDRAVRRRVQR